MLLTHERFRFANEVLLLSIILTTYFIGVTQTALGQTKIEHTGGKVYASSHFDVYSPQTARDMVDRIPGFTIDIGEELRGFGGSGGNVLIDGKRPSSKSGGIDEALDRVPASQVERIEIIKGSGSSGETAGQSMVANVVRKRGTHSGRWEVEIERNDDGLVYPRADLSLARSSGPWDISTKLDAFWEQFPRNGVRESRRDTDTLRFSELEDRPSTLSRATASIEAKRPLSGGLLTLNSRLRGSYFNAETERLRFNSRLPDTSPDERRYIDFTGEFVEGEFGADFVTSIGDNWSGKFLVLSFYKDHDETTDFVQQRPVGLNESLSDIFRGRKTSETVIRGTLNRAGDITLSPEFGTEIAYNRLDSRLSILNTNAIDQSTVELPSANTVVEEVRGEVFANVKWRASSVLLLDSGLTLEASEISVSGDASNSQSFIFAKPHLSVVYDLKEGIQFRLAARRTVGQLDFSDFAASANASDSRVLGGNPDLEPDRTTRVSFSTDLRSKAFGALNFEVFHDWKNDALEQVVLEPGVFGLGNVGKARLWGLEANASVKLDRFIYGALLDIEAEVTDSDVIDPITGLSRELSDVTEHRYSLEYRQDFPNSGVSYGGKYLSDQTSTTHFADEVSESTSGELISIFVETSRFWNAKTRLELSHIGGRKFPRHRVFFSPDRSGISTGYLREDLERGLFVTLTISGQFRAR